MSASMIPGLRREPLVHFLLIGLAFFLLFQVIGPKGGDRSITVDDAIVAGLVTRFEASWQRPPTHQELQSLVESYVRDEIFYREGLALGLDRDDPAVKRRLRQKVEVLAEEERAGAPATNADLRRWLRAYPERYAEPAIVSFQQVMVDPMQRGSSTGATLEVIKAALTEGSDPASLGDGRMLPPRIELLPLDLAARDFGEDFANTLSRAKIGSWEGPVRSGYGLHLIRVERRIPGRLRPIEEVRTAVARDFETDRRSKSADAYYRDLRKEYEVKLPAIARSPAAER